MYSFHILIISVIPSTMEEIPVKSEEKVCATRTTVEENIIHSARSVLLTIQNDRPLAKQFTTELNERAKEVNQKSMKKDDSSPSSKNVARPGITGFLTMIEEFQQYAITNINIPFQVRFQQLFINSNSFFG